MEIHARHSHDLGHEAFLILEGQADIEIDGDRAVLSPGQFCFVRAGQMHQVRNAGDAPLTMYLSVTPHIEPTHTMWTEGGERLPPRYGGATAAERAESVAPAPSLAELAARQDAALRQLLRTVQAAVAAHGPLLAEVKQRQAAGNGAERLASQAAVDALWAELSPLFRDSAALAAAWNDLAIAAGTPA